MNVEVCDATEAAMKYRCPVQKKYSTASISTAFIACFRIMLLQMLPNSYFTGDVSNKMHVFLYLV